MGHWNSSCWTYSTYQIQTKTWNMGGTTILADVIPRSESEQVLLGVHQYIQKVIIVVNIGIPVSITSILQGLDCYNNNDYNKEFTI